MPRACRGAPRALCSLTARDFLRRVGFRDAVVAPVYFTISASRSGEEIHSLGVGDHVAAGQADLPLYGNGWNCHLVVTVGGRLVDTTLYQVQRPQWPGLPGMVAVRLAGRQHKPMFGHAPIAGARAMDGRALVEMLWLDQPDNRSWRHGPDTAPQRRVNVIRQMMAIAVRKVPWRRPCCPCLGA